MDELINFLLRVTRRQIPLPSDEAKTINAIVLPVLRRLGWDTENTDEVIPQYATRSRSVDFCLCCRQEKVFLEVKKPSEDLEKHEEQLLEYAFLEAIDLAVLTNGKVWSFFLSRRRAPVSERKVHSVKVLEQDLQEAARDLADLLSKDNVSTGRALENAEGRLKATERKEAIARGLPKAWLELASGPDKRLLDLLNEELTKLCGPPGGTEAASRFLRALRVGPEWPMTAEERNELIQACEALGIGTEDWCVTNKFPCSECSAPQQRECYDTYLSEARKGKALPAEGGKRRRRAAAGAEPASDYTGKKLEYAEFQGLRIAERSTWKNPLIEFSRLMHARHGPQFGQCLKIAGRKKPYFSMGKPDSRWTEGRAIAGTRYFVETCLNANQIVDICRRLATTFGYQPSDLQIEAE